MSNEPEDEQAYLLRRAAQHRARAAVAIADPARRALHERFAAIYQARATNDLVQEN